jgi:hypothetical protein
MTTGRRLFKAETDLETFDRVRACAVPPPSSIVPGYPRELEAIVMRALSRQREDRFATARELSRALQMWEARGGHFVGAEEIVGVLAALFAGRIREREEHLRWLGEATAPDAPVTLAPIARVEEPLLEDDEDLPTMVLRDPLPLPLPRPAAPEVDLGRTIALSAEGLPAPSPIFAQHRPLPVPPTIFAPPRSPDRERAIAIAGLALLTLLAMAAIGALIALRG